MLLQDVGESLVRELLNRRHTVASKLSELGERVFVKRDQFAHLSSTLPGRVREYFQ